MLEAMCGGEAAYRRPANRRFDETRDEHDAEAQVLLDPAIRLGESGAYADAAQDVSSSSSAATI